MVFKSRPRRLRIPGDRSKIDSSRHGETHPRRQVVVRKTRPLPPTIFSGIRQRRLKREHASVRRLPTLVMRMVHFLPNRYTLKSTNHFWPRSSRKTSIVRSIARNTYEDEPSIERVPHGVDADMFS